MARRSSSGWLWVVAAVAAYFLLFKRDAVFAAGPAAAASASAAQPLDTGQQGVQANSADTSSLASTLPAQPVVAANVAQAAEATFVRPQYYGEVIVHSATAGDSRTPTYSSAEQAAVEEQARAQHAYVSSRVY